MKNIITKFTYLQVNSKEIQSDQEYQRAVDMKRVNSIVSQFNPDLVNPAKVSFRDGKYYVFDGQHTIAALRLRNGNKDLLVDCKVYQGLSQQQEAELFAKQNGISKAVQSIAKFKALYTSGDVDICDFHKLTNSSGIRMDFTTGTAENKISACSKAYNIYKKLLPSDYFTVLNMIKDTWNGIKESLTTEILGGVFVFYKTYKTEFSYKTFVSQLSKISPLVIVRDGKVFTTGGDERYAKQILIAYNKKLRVSKLQEKF